MFRNSRPPRPKWLADLRRLVVPDARSWPAEALALRIEAAWNSLAASNFAELPAGMALDPEFQSAIAALPNTDGVMVANLPGGTCKTSEGAGEAVPMSPADWLRAWRELVVESNGPKISSTESWQRGEAQVLRIAEDTAGTDRWRIELSVRITRGGGERLVRLEQVWKAGRKPVLVWESPLLITASSIARPWFKDATRSAFAPATWEQLDLQGGRSRVERHDRMFPASTQYLGMHGASVGDVNADGLEDLYVAQPGGMGNQLFLGDGRGQLHLAENSGVDFLEDTGGVLLCDLDGDGAQDLVCGLGGTVIIAWNSGSLPFSEFTQLEQVQPVPLDGGAAPAPAAVYSICAADPDGDGDLDLYDTRYFAGGRAGSAPTPYHDAENGAPNSFWRNLGKRQFEDATAAVGLGANNTRFSLAALWEDLDGDGDLDLYVTNDFGRNNLYANEGGMFVDIAEQSDAVDMAAGMGVAAGDVNGDGHLDLYVSNMHAPAGMRVTQQPGFLAAKSPMMREMYGHHAAGNTLLAGLPGGGYARAKDQRGGRAGGWAWGSVLMDFDGDGHLDIFVPNGFASGSGGPDLDSFFWREVVAKSPAKFDSAPAYLQGWQTITTVAIEEGLDWNGAERHYAYWNRGDGRFLDVSGPSGLDFLDDGRGALVCDWDMDGRPDVWLKNRTGPTLRLAHNQIPGEAQWVGLELRGKGANTEAVGARVTVLAGDAKYSARVYAGDAYLSNGSKRRLFGLGGFSDPVKILVEWPDGTREEHASVKANGWYRVVQGQQPTRLAVREPLPDVARQELSSKDLQPKETAQRVRVIPTDRLPVGLWDLPAFSPVRPAVQNLSEGPVLLVFYGSWKGGGQGALKKLITSYRAGASYKMQIVSLDSPRYHESVARALNGMGVLSLSGRGGRRIRNLIETWLGEMMGPAPDRPLPLGMLIDTKDRIAALYLGDLPPEAIERDAVQLAQEDPGAYEGGRDPLAGGYWFGPRPARGLRPLAQFLRRAGEDAIASGLEQAADKRDKESREESREAEQKD